MNFTRRLKERPENTITGADVVDGHLVLRRYDGTFLKVDVDIGATVTPELGGNWVKVSEVDFNSSDFHYYPDYPSHETGDLLVVFFFGRNNMGLGFRDAAGFSSTDAVLDPQGNGQVRVAWKKAESDSESGLFIASGRPGIYGVFICYRNTDTNDADPFVTYEGNDGISNSGTADTDSLQILLGWAEDDFDYPEYLVPTGFVMDAQYNVDATDNAVGKQTFAVMSKDVSGSYSSVEVTPFHMNEGQILFNVLVSPLSP